MLCFFTFLPSTNASFDPSATGARAAGMGEAYTAVANDILALYYNPAGLVQIKRPELLASYSQLHVGLKDNSQIGRSILSYAHPIPKYGSIGVGYFNLQLSNLYSEDVTVLGYATAMKFYTNAGINLKILHKKIGSDIYTQNAINPETGMVLGRADPIFNEGHSKTNFAIDLGGQYRFLPKWAIGICGRNINSPDVAVGSASDKVLPTLAIGVAKKSKNTTLSCDVDNYRSSQQNYRLHLGAEKWFETGFAIRLGGAVGSRNYQLLTSGGSFRTMGMQFDYALQYPLAGIEKTYGTHLSR